MYFRISINRFLDIQKWILDIHKWGINSKTAPHTPLPMKTISKLAAFPRFPLFWKFPISGPVIVLFAPVICKHPPHHHHHTPHTHTHTHIHTHTGNSGGFDFSSSKALLRTLHCGDKQFIKPLLFDTALLYYLYPCYFCTKTKNPHSRGTACGDHEKVKTGNIFPLSHALPCG